MTSSVHPRHSLKTRFSLMMLTIFLAGIWSLSFYVSRLLREDMQYLLGEQQFSTVSLVANGVNEQLDMRLKALETVAASISLLPVGQPEAVQTLLEQRPITQKLFNGGLFVTDTDGTAIADVPRSAGRIGVNYIDRDSVAVPLKEGKPRIGRPSMGKKLLAPIFSLTVPIFDLQGKVIGALVGTINLGKPNFLDKIMVRADGNKAGGFLLIAPQHLLFVTATDKRRVMQPLPAPGLNLMHDKYMQGYEGYGLALNSQGVEELTAAKGIPLAGWFLVTTLPTVEAFAPIRAMQQRMLLATAFLTLLVGSLTWWVTSLLLRRQLSPLLAASRAVRSMSDKNGPLQTLPIDQLDEVGELIDGFNQLLGTLGEREALLTQILNTSSAAIFLVDKAGRITQANRSMAAMFGYPQDALEGFDYVALIHPCEREIGRQKMLALLGSTVASVDVERRYWRADQTEFWGHLTGQRFIDAKGEDRGLVGVIIDVTKRRQAEEEIRSLAFYDPLTALPNRRLLMDRLGQALLACHRDGHKGALLFVDLDNFKTLNDTLGHDKGDLLLQQVALRLAACIREGDTVARLGGDEFVVMLEDLSEDERDAANQAEAVGEKIIATLNQTYQLASYEQHSTPSIGITLFGDQQESIDEPLKRADLAMYQAKAAGRNTLRFFDPQMQAVVTARAALEAGLREALARQQLVLHYQAQVTDAPQLTGVEALVRWQHPQRGMVSPMEFIPLAEETGLIFPLGRWVLETACTQLAQWAARPTMAHLTMAVNVSARQFQQHDFVAQVKAVLAQTGANPQQLKLELTESLLVANVEDIIAKMSALKQLGVGFSLDDFGTGYSSLSYLKRLPLGQLKIDQGFVRDILVDANDAAIAKMVIALADTLGLAVIAEGVETEAQRDFLAGLGCRAYQGYLFSRPLPLDQFEAFVARGSGTACYL